MATSHRTLRSLGVAAALGGSLLACQLLAGVSDEQGSPPPLGPAPTAGPVDLCPHELPPPAPEGADSDDLPPIWFAVSSLEGVTRPDARPFGLDLDGLCTGFLGGTTLDGGAPCRRLVTDEPGGIDNASARLFLALPDGQGARIFRSFARDLREGQRTVLVGLSKYSGKADDPSIQVRFATSEVLEATSCDGGRDPDASPLGEGCDVWSFSEPSLLPDAGAGGVGKSPLEGYVTAGRVVVGTKKPTNIELEVSDLPLAVSHAFFVATLGEKRPGVRTLDGVVAGRLSPAALIAGLARDPDLCSASALQGLKASVCDHRDIPSAPTDDRDNSRACTSLSIGLRLQAIQAKLGGLVPASPGPGPCDAALPACE